MAVASLTITQQARLSYIGISSIVRRSLSTSSSCSSSGQFHRSSFSGQGFTGIYERGPTEGPIADTSNVGAPRVTPRNLKQHLDQFVVGQERAKRVLSTAVYNHYKRVEELQRRDDEEEERLAQQTRREMGQRHPVEGTIYADCFVYLKTVAKHLQDEFPGQQPTVNVWPPSQNLQPPQQQHQYKSVTPPPIFDATPLTLEKSNILLLGPSGVGKTLMAKTLARVLEVPFSMSDCTPFTQAGYIGEDADVCVQRLLAAANYDVSKAERGIICLDEIDKIATAKVSHGKDVSGEGVQQALLKIIEGTTLQIQAKQERGHTGGPARGPGSMGGGGFPTNSPLSGGNVNQPGGGKGDVYNVRTDNILFICTGAFIGLHRMIMDRVSRGSIGFGANVRAAVSSETGAHETMISGEDELFKKHLPFFTDGESLAPNTNGSKTTTAYNTLDLVEPSDLQKYGLIPELVGRIPISCALSTLDEDALVKVLTEPRNSLLRQYEQLFQLSNIELRFTSGALREVARSAATMSTGARGLRTVMERLLGEAMFATPGSSWKYVLVTEDVAKRKCAPIYMEREHRSRFHAMIAAEEEAWEERRRLEEAGESEWEKRARVNSEGGAATTFEEYREKARAAGFV
ncbi:ATP-binding protein [Elasticomyces elasticus]|nr:ATP-binding protein [Elasticomyces elasticus]